MALDLRTIKHDFGDPKGEAKACRSGCALFDFSFLECARIEGGGAASLIGSFTGRSIAALERGQIFYALRVNQNGKALADLTVWRTDTNVFEVMSGRRQDILDLLALDGAGVRVTDLSVERAVFSIQGPATLDALDGLGDHARLARLDYFNFDCIDLAGKPCIVGRLGYTGEAGFEIIAARADAGELWEALSGAARPAGFAAADMLRIEAGFVLFTNEFRLAVSPGEAGLGKFHQAATGAEPRVRLISFRAEADGLSWPWQAPRVPQRPTIPGVIAATSACSSVAAGGILGLGYVAADTAAGAPLQDPTGIFRNVRPTALPFYDTTKRRPRRRWR